jgi:N-dimethylarginine dimethylaminohydrolase
VAGYLKRTDICAHRYLSQLTGKQVLSLELVDDRWYHLDTCFLPLGGRLVAYYPEAFDWYARRVIEQHFETIPVSPEEALKFACNSVVDRQASGDAVQAAQSCASIWRSAATRCTKCR